MKRAHILRAVAFAMASPVASAQVADMVLTPPVGGAVSITNAAGTITRLRVADDGSIALSGLLKLEDTSATTGVIHVGPVPFIHNFGVFNTFVGRVAGNFTMTGLRNTGIGGAALLHVTTGSENTAVGESTLSQTTDGRQNVAVGYLAMSHNTSGIENVASGFQALFNNTTGNSSIAVGWGALNQSTTGNANIAIGRTAGFNVTTGSSNIHIGSAGAAEGNTIRIGDGNQNRAFIAGIRGVTTGSANAIPVMIDSNGQLGTLSSSERFKDDIADMGEASDALMNLRPVTFHYKADEDPAGRTLQYGLVAEEVAEVYPGLVAHSADGQVETVMYQLLPPMLLNEIQKLRRTVEAQAERIRVLEQRLEPR